ncbi:MAG: hypothetical protein RR555_05295, partial [Bacteroidales bacterium]
APTRDAAKRRRRSLDGYEILANISGLFMLTMFPHSKLQEYIDKYKWNKHVVERCITASRDKRRKQIEWIITNY